MISLMLVDIGETDGSASRFKCPFECLYRSVLVHTFGWWHSFSIYVQSKIDQSSSEVSFMLRRITGITRKITVAIPTTSTDPCRTRVLESFLQFINPTCFLT